jgi:hypothetical protein
MRCPRSRSGSAGDSSTREEILVTEERIDAALAELWHGVQTEFERINPGQSVAKIMHERSLEGARAAFVTRVGASLQTIGREWRVLGDTAVIDGGPEVRFGPSWLRILSSGRVVFAGWQRMDWAALVLACIGESEWGEAWWDEIRRSRPARHRPIAPLDASDPLGEFAPVVEASGGCRWVVYGGDSTVLCWAMTEGLAERAASALELGSASLGVLLDVWPEVPPQVADGSRPPALWRFPAPRVGIETAWWLLPTTPFSGLFWRGGLSLPRANTFPRLRAVSTDARIATENFSVPYASAFITATARDVRYRSAFPDNQEFALFPDAKFVQIGEITDGGSVHVSIFADESEPGRPPLEERDVVDHLRAATAASPARITKPRWFIDD